MKRASFLSLVLSAACSPAVGDGIHDSSESTSVSDDASAGSATATVADDDAGTATSDDGGDEAVDDETASGEGGTNSVTGGSATETGCDDAPRAVIFLEFDGVTLEEGPIDDATANVTQTRSLVGTFAPAHASIDRAAVTEGIAMGLAPFAVEVTRERPESGPYTMIVFSGTESGTNAISLTTVDCLVDQYDLNDANVGVSYAQETQMCIRTGLAIAGQSFGLELSNGEDAMNVFPIYEPTFLDDCFDLYAPQLQMCAHPGCGDGQQNSYRHLEQVVGLASSCAAD